MLELYYEISSKIFGSGQGLPYWICWLLLGSSPLVVMFIIKTIDDVFSALRKPAKLLDFFVDWRDYDSYKDTVADKDDLMTFEEWIKNGKPKRSMK